MKTYITVRVKLDMKVPQALRSKEMGEGRHNLHY